MATRHRGWARAGAIAIGLGWCSSAPAAVLTADQINGAQWKRLVSSPRKAHPLVLKAQVLLDRAHVSPGALDGKTTPTFAKALKVYQARKSLPVTGKLDRATWKTLSGGDSEPVLVSYKVTQNDINGPFTQKIPATMRERAKLKALNFTSSQEQLAERFHIEEPLLKALNPRATLKKPGEKLVVPRVGGSKLEGEVARVVVDRVSNGVKAYGKDRKLLAFFPATVGSKEFPSPKGHLKVTAIAPNPTFTVTSNLKYAKVKKGERLELPPGPNNPAGRVWIGLNKSGYGLHGTPSPERIRERQSHGCVRLTNWDVAELASLVKPGTPVLFEP